MDFLLDPNIAYLILLGSIMLTFLAVVIPGTGLPETGALFSFLLVGYEVYRISVNWWAAGILLLSIFPLIYALSSRKTVFISVFILLLITGSAFFFVREGEFISVNPFLAAVASIFMAAFFWVIATKYLQVLALRPSHDLEVLVGKIGEARTAIHADGSVYVNSELWSARSEIEIPQGSRVRVMSREGFILVVEKIE